MSRVRDHEAGERRGKVCTTVKLLFLLSNAREEGLAVFLVRAQSWQVPLLLIFLIYFGRPPEPNESLLVEYEKSNIQLEDEEKGYEQEEPLLSSYHFPTQCFYLNPMNSCFQDHYTRLGQK